MKFLRMLVLLLIFSTYLNAETLKGEVVDITDGDTFTVLVDDQTIKIRIYGIDAPENGQPFGRQAKDGLIQLIFGQQVQIEKEKLDRYGMIIGKVIVDGDVDVGLSLVAYGHAWVNRRYVKDPFLYSLEDKAKGKKIGLWALPIKDRAPPWAWKHGQKYANHDFTYENSKKKPKAVLSDGGNYSKSLPHVNTDSSSNFYNGKEIQIGPRGGRYVYTNSGEKRYLPKIK